MSDITTLAKNKLKSLKERTLKELYELEYGNFEKTPLNDEVFKKIKDICDDLDMSCPMYKYGGEIQLKNDLSTYDTLGVLAQNYNIIIDSNKLKS